ncbi:LysR family transcriptional regulator [Pandoraea capi]|nr:LysR family transcriptional regulator [Pandoraea sp. LA3]MDN4584432.1 LysR family transcriptional regulator [Pandoraea capi]
MTLKQLEAFYWAATHGSFAVAANRLSVTPSSLSKRIQELESDIGRQLFDRTTPRVTLTDAGHRLLGHARQMLDVETRIRDDLLDDALRGTCRFGISELVATTWFPRFVTHVRAQHPELVLAPHVDLTYRCEQRLERGEFDFAIIPGPPSSPRLASEEICELAYSWAASPNRLASGTTLTPAHFLAHPVVSLAPEAHLSALVHRWAAEHKLELPHALTCNSLHALAELTIAGVGISVFPRHYLRPLVERGHLVELTSVPPLPDMRYCIDWRRDDSRRIISVMKGIVMRLADFTSVPGIVSGHRG